MNLNKFLGLFSVVGVCLLLFSACQKEEITQQTFEKTNVVEVAQPLSQSTAKTGTSCQQYSNLKKSFCYSKYVIAFPNNPIARISIQTTKETYTIEPLINKSKVQDFLVTMANGEKYVITQTENKYLQAQKDEKFIVPNHLKALYLFDDLIVQGDFSASEIAQRLGRQAKVEQGKGLLSITLPDHFITKKAITVIAIPWCPYNRAKTVQKYLSNLGFPQNSGYEAVVSDAISACTSDSEFCGSCVDPICVFQNLLPLLSTADAEQAKAGFVKYGLGLSSATMGVLEDYPDMIATLYGELGTGDIESFCDSEGLVSVVVPMLEIEGNPDVQNFLLENSSITENVFVFLITQGSGVSCGFETFATLSDYLFLFTTIQNHQSGVFAFCDVVDAKGHVNCVETGNGIECKIVNYDFAAIDYENSSKEEIALQLFNGFALASEIRCLSKSMDVDVSSLYYNYPQTSIETIETFISFSTVMYPNGVDFPVSIVFNFIYSNDCFTPNNNGPTAGGNLMSFVDEYGASALEPGVTFKFRACDSVNNKDYLTISVPDQLTDFLHSFVNECP